MPLRRRFRRRRPRRRRPRYGLATVPRMMPRALAMKRHNQVATKVFWMKLNGQVDVPPLGTYLSIFRTRGLTIGPVIPFGKTQLFELYDQFKVLAMRIKWFPADVGTEPGAGTVGPLQPEWRRGDQVIWSDQRVDSTQQVPQFISEVISNASCKMINPRRPQTRVIYRPQGTPTWGSCVDPATRPDSWDGAVYQLTNNATSSTVSGKPLWYYTLTYKVCFRGRRQN